MTSKTKLGVTFAGIVVAIGLAASLWRAPADVPTANLVTPPPSNPDPATSTATAAITGKATSANPLESSRPAPRPASARSAQPEPADENSREALRSAQHSGVRDQLEAESQLLGPISKHPDGTEGPSVNARALKPILKGDGFDEFLDTLAKQASDEPLAQDLAKLYSNIAHDAAKSAEGVTVNRIVCGMKMCLGSIAAPSREAFAPWMVSFMTNPSTQTLTFGRYDNQLPDGSFEFRVTFTTDPSIKSVGLPGGK